MVFFQLFLVAGYAYAHLLTQYCRPRTQSVVHLILLMVAFCVLPITPGESWKPESQSNPTWYILQLLTVCLGLPYFVLSATGPLVQKWFSLTYPGRSPYRLYVQSNWGSFLALGTYPFLIEPHFSRHAQATLWSFGLVFFALICGYCALRFYKLPCPSSTETQKERTFPTALTAPSFNERLLWVGFAATASLLLLATTNKLCQEVAVVPFLWIIPLSIYLFSFILCFDNPERYSRTWFAVAFFLGIAELTHVMLRGDRAPIGLQVGVYLIVLFICCVICHGEIARLKPSPTYLTSYYLCIAVGGALGGLVVAVGAPLVFVGYYEFHLGLLVCAGLALIRQIFDNETATLSRSRYLPHLCFALAFLLVGREFVTERRSRLDDAIAASRNFFGILTLREKNRDNPEHHHYLMVHGSIVHGLQLVQPARHRQPTSYYGEQSGVGLALQYAPHQGGRRIGIIGLGVGTLAAFGQERDYLRFYEIDPAVQELAENRFTYLKESPARIDIILGDARVSLEREAPQQFDVLVIDAFSSDAVPIHLLTREAFAVYMRHLKPDGVIAAHVSNKYLDLKPVVIAAADHFGLQWVVIHKRTAKETWWEYNSTWILLTTNQAFLNRSEITAAAEPSPNSVSPLVWTDAYSALFHVLKK